MQSALTHKAFTWEKTCEGIASRHQFYHPDNTSSLTVSRTSEDISKNAFVDKFMKLVGSDCHGILI